MPKGQLVHQVKPTRVDYYYEASLTVPTGAEDQELDLHAALATLGRDPNNEGVSTAGVPVFIRLKTDVAITWKINDTALAAMPLTVATGATLPADIMKISKLYFTHTGASSASGDASVEILAI